MRRIGCPVILGLAVMMAWCGASPAAWYARGDFNGWDLSTPMVDQGGGYYTATITGLTAGNPYEYKIANEDWSSYAPGSNGKVPADGSGEINLHFWENSSWADGWEPSTQMRVGYDDPGQFGWGVIGAFDGWTGDTVVLADQGGGLYAGQVALNAGTYEWKFREEGSWDYSIGDNFGNSAANNSLTVANNGDVWAFELDLPNGRWRAYQVPEPSTLALVGLALVGLAIGWRRK
jgi:hypothetical protein